MSVRANFTDDGATRYEDMRGGLNKMSLARFEWLVADGGLEIEYCKYDYVLGLTFLEKLPLLRELLIYHNQRDSQAANNLAFLDGSGVGAVIQRPATD